MVLGRIFSHRRHAKQPLEHKVVLSVIEHRKLALNGNDHGIETKFFQLVDINVPLLLQKVQLLSDVFLFNTKPNRKTSICFTSVKG